jgi:arginine/lysine/ornithine decarboxylase
MLDQKLEEYAKSDIYPFHMPGHKRRMQMEVNPYRIDITEIDGFDNLHHAEDVLLDAQRRAAELYGSQKAYYLVNGSTCGLLSAICAATERGGEILIARNCHKAVYHGIELRGLVTHYLYPEITEEGIACAITPEALQAALQQYPGVEAVLITSPTYDGIVSDVARIAEIVHKKEIPLIVDEAHGAHFGISECFPESAVRAGADVVIQSLHKTLPSFTQTALLHICSGRVSARKIEQFLDIFETSSPSYVLMAGMERCIRMMTEEGAALLEEFFGRLTAFADKMKRLEKLRLLTKASFPGKSAYDFDASKLLIYTGDADITGKQLYDLLLQKYGLQMEMASGSYVLAMTSFMDTEEGFDRLAQALLSIDRTLKGNGSGQKGEQAAPFSVLYAPQEQLVTISEARDADHSIIPLEEAKDRTAADFLYLYPPGIPLIAPGERITGKTIRDIHSCCDMGLQVHGLLEEMRIEVVNFS